MKEGESIMQIIGLNFDFNKKFFYENAFYLTSRADRTAKFLAHYELFKMTIDLPGDIVECGVFKGASLARFIKFRNIFNLPSKKVIGFDIFGEFPEADFESDVSYREKFIKDAGSQSIPLNKLMEFLKTIDCFQNVELVQGDVCQTIPKYISENPGFSISLLNIDVDLHKPTKEVLNHLYDRIVKGGVLILDDYNGFPGATTAIDEFCNKRKIKIEKFPWVKSPYYIKK